MPKTAAWRCAGCGARAIQAVEVEEECFLPMCQDCARILMIAHGKTNTRPLAPWLPCSESDLRNAFVSVAAKLIKKKHLKWKQFFRLVNAEWDKLSLDRMMLWAGDKQSEEVIGATRNMLKSIPGLERVGESLKESQEPVYGLDIEIKKEEDA